MNNLLGPKSRYAKLSQALLQLKAFAAEPVVSKRDRAGLIKAFEFTYELFWKTFQDFVNAAGVTIAGPKPSLKAAFQLGIIDNENGWLAIADDRNLTSHIYNESLAIDISRAIIDRHLPLMSHTHRVMADYAKTLTS